VAAEEGTMRPGRGWSGATRARDGAAAVRFATFGSFAACSKLVNWPARVAYWQALIFMAQ
jgi:hypothetical protein